MADFVALIDRVPSFLIYLALGIGAAMENVIPAIPADTFVALGGFLTAVGNLQARWVFAATWLCNVGSALAMYRLGYAYGRTFFEQGFGRHLLRPHQMERMERFYDRWGTPAVFLMRFLPGLRSVVPVFAGVSLQGWLPVALPLALASAIWYGGLVWIGAVAGQNVETVGAILSRVNRLLLVVAGLVIVLIMVWWWHTRHRTDE